MKGEPHETIPLRGKQSSKKFTRITAMHVPTPAYMYFLYVLTGLCILGFVAAMIVGFVYPPKELITPTGMASSLLPNIPLTKKPSFSPTNQPTDFPTGSPTKGPTTAIPTDSPTKKPTFTPTTAIPTDGPTTRSPSNVPTTMPTDPVTPFPTPA